MTENRNSKILKSGADWQFMAGEGPLIRKSIHTYSLLFLTEEEIYYAYCYNSLTQKFVYTYSLLPWKEKEIYYVQSETNPRIRYRVNFEDGTCTCADFQKRGEVCKHFYKVVMEKAIA